MNKLCALILFACCTLSSVFSQSQSLDTLEYETRQRNKLVVLKNENGLLPFKRLDTLVISSLPSLQIDSYINRYLSSNNDAPANINIKTLGASQVQSGKQILILFEEDVASEAHLADYDAIIYASEKSEESIDRISQLLFGGIGTKDTLTKDLGVFPKGSGMELTGGLRFSYQTPETLGYDGASLRFKLDSIANNAIDSGVAPGIQILVAKHGVVLYHQTYGYTTYENISEVDTEMLYDFASVTKITGALPALMKLHDEDKFSLDATMGTYLPYFARGNKKKLQYRRVLSHNAGLKAWIPYWTTTIKKNGKYKRNTLSKSKDENFSIEVVDGLYLHKDYRDKIYKQIKKSPLSGNQNYVYSGLSFYLYPEVVEQLSGENYEKYIQNNFYAPLGANTITYNPLQKFNRDRIIPTEVDTFFRMSPLHGTVHDEGAAMMRGVSSNAGLFGTTQDLAKIMQMYLWMGEYGGERYISKATMEKFTSCHYCQEGNRRGLAFDKPVLENKQAGSTAIDASEHSFGHSGYTGTFAWADPDTGILFLFMSNRVYPTRENRKLYQLNVRPAMHQIIYDFLK